ncbi:hypothetical protein K8O68_10740 [Salipaludibacillus sp. CUR1]|uniref:hypothetical protein n=1 Tax=Salipaludibacillus sp. CUR1 TaxID=2820003 RepID=UPI001E47E215|nr:hypothetical protein [Salipaludibacillus sp. CUR1]MCE7792891.1 hypothetical protein [Salipaludibacillus sp. CUR1]
MSVIVPALVAAALITMGVLIAQLKILDSVKASGQGRAETAKARKNAGISAGILVMIGAVSWIIASLF